MEVYDICIIGAGVVGCAIARELSKFELKVILLEKTEDVSNGASKANSGIVHGGYAATHGTLKSQLSVEGNRMFKELDKELNFGFRQTESIVVGFTEEDCQSIKGIYENGLKNGVQGLEIISGERVIELEPHINPKVKIGLLSKYAGITSPYEMTIALAENAIVNGVTLKLRSEVMDLYKEEDLFIIRTAKEYVKAKCVINAAGVYSDKIANMVGLYDFRITPRRGQYVLFEKGYGKMVNRVIFQVPSSRGKGVLVTSTYYGNLMIGPNAEVIDDKENVSTNSKVLDEVVQTARRSIPDFDLRKVITSFSGIRATSNTNDFIIGESRVKGFINAAGIDSPGLTASPAIAKRVLEILAGMNIDLVPKENFIARREPIIQPKELDHEELKRRTLLPSCDERIICRCEQVSEGEIVDAIHRGIEIRSTDAIKRRTRAGMGTCQGSFCRPKVAEIIAREQHIPVEEVTLRGPGSSILPERAKRNFYKENK